MSPQEISNLSPALKHFKEELDSFVLFHLGADAQVELDDFESGIRVRLEHSRVHPFNFKLSIVEIGELAADPDSLERFMLDKLTQNRRHA